MELDFKGTWRTRCGLEAKIKCWEADKDVWFGSVVNEFGDDIWSAWNKDGIFVGINDKEEYFCDWDLMERISERWSSERSGGENG